MSSERPEHRTALIARELGRYQVDIAALSETRLSDKEQLTELGGGYTFFWSGRKRGERRGIGKCNSNGLRLLKTCTVFGLIITNTLFRLSTRNMTSWMHPRSRHWHLIDFIIVRSKDRQDVKVTKSMCGAKCWTDHRLIICKLFL